VTCLLAALPVTPQFQNASACALMCAMCTGPQLPAELSTSSHCLIQRCTYACARACASVTSQFLIQDLSQLSDDASELCRAFRVTQSPQQAALRHQLRKHDSCHVCIVDVTIAQMISRSRRLSCLHCICYGHSHSHGHGHGHGQGNIILATSSKTK
jgi:hypothetical protein